MCRWHDPGSRVAADRFGLDSFFVGVSAAVFLGALRRRAIAAEASGLPEPATLALIPSSVVDGLPAGRASGIAAVVIIVGAALAGTTRPGLRRDWELSVLCKVIAAAAVVLVAMVATFIPPRSPWVRFTLNWFGVVAAALLLTRGWG